MHTHVNMCAWVKNLNANLSWCEKGVIPNTEKLKKSNINILLRQGLPRVKNGFLKVEKNELFHFLINPEFFKLILKTKTYKYTIIHKGLQTITIQKVATTLQWDKELVPECKSTTHKSADNFSIAIFSDERSNAFLYILAQVPIIVSRHFE